MDALATTQPPATSPSALAACRRLTVTHGSGEARVVALDRVDLEIGRGEKVALWGPSGSGKTTLLHALGGLVEPTDGVVTWVGEPLSDWIAEPWSPEDSRRYCYEVHGVTRAALQVVRTDVTDLAAARPPTRDRAAGD